MKQILITTLFLFLAILVFGQTKNKQSSPYFEFTYKCEFMNSDFDSSKNIWTYNYGDSINDVVIIISFGVKETHWGDKECIDGMSGDYGMIKITSGYFCGFYASISKGKEYDGSHWKSATFVRKKHIYSIAVLSPINKSVENAYNQIEKSFIFK